MHVEGSELLLQHLARVPVHRALIRTLENRLFSEEKLRHPVLDIGCGDGHFAAVAFPEGIEVGIDVTEAIVAEARQRGPYRSTAVGDGTVLPYADETFCTVVSNCVIEHIPDIESVVREIARVLVPGGVFVFSVPNHCFTDMLFTTRTLRRVKLGRLASRYGSWWNGNAAHHHLDSPATWRRRLARYGMTVDRQVDYMSEGATAMFELSHYYAIPSIIWHRLSGRWSLRPERTRSSLAYLWLRPYAEEVWPDVGSCTFFLAHK